MDEIIAMAEDAIEDGAFPSRDTRHEPNANEKRET